MTIIINDYAQGHSCLQLSRLMARCVDFVRLIAVFVEQFVQQIFLIDCLYVMTYNELSAIMFSQSH